MTTTKRELRALMSARKKEYDMDVKKEKSAEIFRQLQATDQFRNAQNILCYWSLSDEVHTHLFVPEIARAGKRVFLPVVAGDDLLIREFTASESLVEGGSFAIPEPDVNAAEVSIREIDLVIVPGVAFDRRGARMGRGKGFYDRLLTGAEVAKIGVCFDFQLVEEVPTDDHDVMMDGVIFA